MTDWKDCADYLDRVRDGLNRLGKMTADEERDFRRAVKTAMWDLEVIRKDYEKLWKMYEKLEGK